MATAKDALELCPAAEEARAQHFCHRPGVTCQGVALDEGVAVRFPLAAGRSETNGEWDAAAAQHHIGHGARDPPVPIREWVEREEAVARPRGLGLW